jgi:hypothetical protein
MARTLQKTIPSGLVLLQTEFLALSTSGGGNRTVNLTPSIFNGITPSKVFFMIRARGGSGSDFRAFYIYRTALGDTIGALVFGASSDDTDQNGTARLDATSTFVIDYSPSIGLTAVQNVLATTFSWNVYVIGYQI